MRELKFRVWNNNTNKYEYTELDYYFVIDQRVKAYEYEQYTGLKDKNGKEIYEGDIVKLTGKVAENKCSIYKVGWDGFLVAFNLFPLERNKADIGYLNEVEAHRYNVIGNIHENPELLEGAE